MEKTLAIKGARFDRNSDDFSVESRRHDNSRNAKYTFIDNRGLIDGCSVISSANNTSVASLISAQQEGRMGNTLGAQSSMGASSMAAGTAAVAAVMHKWDENSHENNNVSKESGNRIIEARGQSEDKTSGTLGAATKDGYTNRYWSSPIDSVQGNTDDLVVIHVCDETRQISKDFCCKRDVLVKHMKYFEKFLQENESGYDDIDISVHCDVEIFEWLMTYIHEPEKPPVLEKGIVVSILISSEFLQMDTLVEHCLKHIASSLNETIRLPIDLSCISDRTVNRLAALTHPKTLAHTKDRKDKILNKLYKRRVELDFSRKSSARGGIRTIAASLTSCRYCGMVYLDNWVTLLHCSKSPLAIDEHGRLAKRHTAIPGWSLTSYLKSLHAEGMNWDAIYWHVWSACQVFRVGEVMVSASEIERYKIEPDGLLLFPSFAIDSPSTAASGPTSPTVAFAAGASGVPGGPGDGFSDGMPPRPAPHAQHLLPFSLSAEDDTCSPFGSYGGSKVDGVATGGGETKAEHKRAVKLLVTNEDIKAAPSNVTYTLNPNRPPELLPPQIYELVCTQTKYLSSATNRAIIDKVIGNILQVANKMSPSQPSSLGDFLWSDLDCGLRGDRDPRGRDERTRGRSRSPNGRKGKNGPQGVLTSKSQTPAVRPSTKGGSSKEKKSSAPNSNSGSLERSSRPREGSQDSRTGATSSDSDAGDPKTETRSKSVGALSQRCRKVGQNAPGGTVGSGGATIPMRRVLHKPGEHSFKNVCATNPALGRKLSMFKTISPNISRNMHSISGAVDGVWMQPHPLQLYPIQFADSINQVKDSGLAENKKLEWTMDLIREFDDKRFDRFEHLLISKRNIVVGTQSNSTAVNRLLNLYKATNPPATSQSGKSQSSSGSNEQYYLDKGRQPQNIYPSTLKKGTT